MVFPTRNNHIQIKIRIELAAKDYSLVLTERDGMIRFQSPIFNENQEVLKIETVLNTLISEDLATNPKIVFQKLFFEVKKELSSRENNSRLEIEIRFLISELEVMTCLQNIPRTFTIKSIGWREMSRK